MQSCVRPVRAALGPLAMMVSADEVPICFAGHDALDPPWVVLASGLTGSPSVHIVLATHSSCGPLAWAQTATASRAVGAR